eukprot:m.74472 g.74472  ORF g.74472 m.74472 type:complete len:273 (+) comp12463_c0_seq3:451-1269(+)
MASKLLAGACIGAVRWPTLFAKQQQQLPQLYTSLMKHQTYQHDTLLLSLLNAKEEVQQYLKAPHATWVPVFNVVNSKKTAEMASTLGGSGILVSDDVAIVTDSSQVSAIVTMANSLPPQPFIAYNATLPTKAGMPCWMDLLTSENGEDNAVQYWTELMGWKRGKEIAFPAGKYVTLMDGLGDENRCKLAGVLPRLAFPNPGPYEAIPTWVVFFMAPNQQAVYEAAENLPKFGGKLVVPPMEADGTVVICQDEEGAIFGYYHRTDPPDEIKQS